MAIFEKCHRCNESYVRSSGRAGSHICPDRREKDFYSSLGKKIRSLREFHGLKQKDLAKKLNVANSYICEMEQGKKPVSTWTLHKIKELLPAKVIERTWENF